MWDQRYQAPGYAFGKDPNDFLAQHFQRMPPGPVLALADGEGRNGVFLATQGYDVTAVDASAVGLQKAQALATERGVEIKTVVADLADFEILPGAWAGIVSIFCHLPLPLRQRVHRQVVAGLQPGGVFLLEAYRPEQLRYQTGGPPTADLMMTLDTLTTEIQGLELEYGQELEREIHEGSYHQGRSAVVQIIAQKPLGRSYKMT